MTFSSRLSSCRPAPRSGPLRSVVPEAVAEFLDCGRLESGFARLRYAAFCKPDTRISFMYMRATIELATADRARLKRCTYNVAAMSPRANEIAASVVKAAVPQKVTITFDPAEWRQKILDSWPRALEDRCAREEWGWRPQYDLEAMTREMVAKALLPRE